VRVFHDGKWREATIDEILPNEDKTNLASVYVPDPRFIGYGVDSWRLRKDESGMVVGLERFPAIQIKCDATDNDKDGVPDIVADGKSVVHITAVTADSTDTDITFRTTRGVLSQRTGRRKEIILCVATPPRPFPWCCS